ncbi:MAG: hypothetical protein JW862_17940 [Anaerolineales bacterium]|nr:hypothetical protein [Anaerolineales bacterium]
MVASRKQQPSIEKPLQAGPSRRRQADQRQQHQRVTVTLARYGALEQV